MNDTGTDGRSHFVRKLSHARAGDGAAASGAQARRAETVPGILRCLQLRPAFSAGFFYEGVAGKEIFGKLQQEGPRKSREATRKRRTRQLGVTRPSCREGIAGLKLAGMPR